MVGERPGLVAVSAMVDVLESTGSDVYAHLSLNGAGRPGSALDDPVLRELAQATAAEDPEVALATGVRPSPASASRTPSPRARRGGCGSTPAASTCSTPRPAVA